MSLNVKLLEVIEDIDPTTRQTRLRARVQELSLRIHLVNLKNCNTDQLNTLSRNVGATVSLPAREMMMDGRFMVSLPNTDEEFFILRPADKDSKPLPPKV